MRYELEEMMKKIYNGVLKAYNWASKIANYKIAGVVRITLLINIVLAAMYLMVCSYFAYDGWMTFSDNLDNQSVSVAMAELSSQWGTFKNITYLFLLVPVTISLLVFFDKPRGFFGKKENRWTYRELFSRMSHKSYLYGLVAVAGRCWLLFTCIFRIMVRSINSRGTNILSGALVFMILGYTFLYFVYQIYNSPSQAYFGKIHARIQTYSAIGTIISTILAVTRSDGLFKITLAAILAVFGLLVAILLTERNNFDETKVAMDPTKVRCPSCGAFASETEEECPVCGHPMKEITRQKKRRVLPILNMLTVDVVIFGVMILLLLPYIKYSTSHQKVSRYLSSNASNINEAIRDEDFYFIFEDEETGKVHKMDILLDHEYLAVNIDAVGRDYLTVTHQPMANKIFQRGMCKDSTCPQMNENWIYMPSALHGTYDEETLAQYEEMWLFSYDNYDVLTTGRGLQIGDSIYHVVQDYGLNENNVIWLDYNAQAHYWSPDVLPEDIVEEQMIFGWRKEDGKKNKWVRMTTDDLFSFPINEQQGLERELLMVLVTFDDNYDVDFIDITYQK